MQTPQVSSSFAAPTCFQVVYDRWSLLHCSVAGMLFVVPELPEQRVRMECSAFLFLLAQHGANDVRTAPLGIICIAAGTTAG